MLCAVLIILFAISAYTYTANAGYTHKPPDDLPEQNLMKAVDEIDLGVDRNFVTSKLGQPRHTKKVEGGSCTDYEFPFASVQIMFDRDDKVFFRYVVAKQDSYRPDILGDYLLDKKGCLAASRFAMQAENRRPLQHRTTPIRFRRTGPRTTGNLLWCHTAREGKDLGFLLSTSRTSRQCPTSTDSSSWSIPRMGSAPATMVPMGESLKS